jgi:thiol-disulfide isomerase/thioredoxin
MATYLNKPVAYLEDQDIDATGNLIAPGIPKNKPVVVMVQVGWCPHCTEAKPAFQEFANWAEKNDIFTATIQPDGERESEKTLGQRIKNIVPDFKGFPHYVLYINGKPVNKQVQGRSVEDLKKFASV